jgi:hypothetical protein
LLPWRYEAKPKMQGCNDFLSRRDPEDTKNYPGLYDIHEVSLFRPRYAEILVTGADGSDATCPLMAISGHSSRCGFMSAFGGKADIVSIGDLCPLLTQSGHCYEILGGGVVPLN